MYLWLLWKIHMIEFFFHFHKRVSFTVVYFGLWVTWGDIRTSHWQPTWQIILSLRVSVSKGVLGDSQMDVFLPLYLLGWWFTWSSIRTSWLNFSENDFNWSFECSSRITLLSMHCNDAKHAQVASFQLGFQTFLSPRQVHLHSLAFGRNCLLVKIPAVGDYFHPVRYSLLSACMSWLCCHWSWHHGFCPQGFDSCLMSFEWMNRGMASHTMSAV